MSDISRVAIDSLVSTISKWNPRLSDPVERFAYIDLSSVNRETKDIGGAQDIYCADAPSRARQLVKANDVLVSTVRPNLNGVALVPEPLDGATASTGFCVLRAQATKLDPRYLFHWVKSPHFISEMTNRATGANYPAVTDRIVRESAIPLLPLPEQKRIAAILDKADALRTKRQAALAKLDELTQSIFLEMFGDPAINPKGWPLVSVTELLEDAEVFVDGDWVESKDQDPDGDVRLIQLADIGDGIYINKSARFLTKETAIRLRCTSLKRGDVLIARMPDPLGRACIFPGDPKESVTVVDVCIVRPRNHRPDPVWLMHCINAQGFRQAMLRRATGTTRARISRGNLSKLEIIAPPYEDQQRFSLTVNQLQSVRQQMDIATADVEQLFSSLQHRAFSGTL